jgi:hypothetical protein
MGELDCFDEKRLKWPLNIRGIKAREGEPPSRLLIIFVHRVDEGTIGKLQADC